MRFKVLYLLVFIIYIPIYTCYSQANITFINEVVNVDTIFEGINSPLKYIFKNSGDSSLLISSVRSSCGCTIPKYERKEIAPGQYDTIYATYNSVGHLGKIDKPIIVESNASNGTKTLKVTGLVIPYDSHFRMYYSSSEPTVHYSVDNNKNLYYEIDTPGKNKLQDVSLVLYQTDDKKTTFALDKSEMQQKGISLKIMKQSNRTVSIETIDPSTLLLSKEYTYILRFNFEDRVSKSISATINGKKIQLFFDFK